MDRPQLGDAFLHVRYLNENGEPALCEITSVAGGEFWYDVYAVNGSISHKDVNARYGKLHRLVLTWVDREE